MRNDLLAILFSGLCAIPSGCSAETPEPAPSERTPPSLPVPPEPGSASGAELPASSEDSLRVVFLGDSLTAGYGLAEDEAYPALLEAQLREAGHAVEVVNAGRSGDTSAGGLARIDWLLRQQPDLVVVALGGNDGLRGLPVDALESNLRGILERVQAAGSRALLVGMRMAPNYGPEYTSAFDGLYPKLAAELGVPLVPFLLEGVGGEEELNQADGIHPTAAGQALLARNVWPALSAEVAELQAP